MLYSRSSSDCGQTCRDHDMLMILHTHIMIISIAIVVADAVAVLQDDDGLHSDRVVVMHPQLLIEKKRRLR